MTWTCPKCERSFRQVNQRHACGLGRRATLLENRPGALADLYETLEATITGFGSGLDLQGDVSAGGMLGGETTSDADRLGRRLLRRHARAQPREGLKPTMLSVVESIRRTSEGFLVHGLGARLPQAEPAKSERGGTRVRFGSLAPVAEFLPRDVVLAARTLRLQRDQAIRLVHGGEWPRPESGSSSPSRTDRHMGLFGWALARQRLLGRARPVRRTGGRERR